MTLNLRKKISKMQVWGAERGGMSTGRRLVSSKSTGLRRENQFDDFQAYGSQRSWLAVVFLRSRVVNSWLLSSDWSVTVKLLHLCCFIKSPSASHYGFISPGKSLVHCRPSVLDYILLMSGVSVFQLHTLEWLYCLCLTVLFYMFFDTNIHPSV